MPTSNHPVADAFAANPLLIDPAGVDVVNASINYLATNERAAELLDAEASAAAHDEFWDERYDWARPYNVSGGILQVPVQGALLNKFPFAFGRWATGYQYIERAVERGLADPEVNGIALVIDSPGGEVSGCFELCDKLFESRGEKPIRAFASDSAYSAAYAIASSADDITVSRSGGTGSVGVVTAHIDYSEALAREGIKVTFIYAGKHKVDGNPYEALPDETKARIKSRIDRLYGVFTSTVARNRGIEESDVRGTEALTFDAEDSISEGFADRIAALEEELAVFSAAAKEGITMSVKTETPKGDTTFTQAQVDAAVAEAVTAAVATATAEATASERARLTAILGSEEGKARPKAALSLALKSNESAESVASLLADFPEEKAEAPAPAPKATGTTPFDAAMSNGNPEVGAEAPADQNADDEEAASASILASVRAARGVPARKQ